jgi:hypothetical protein
MKKLKKIIALFAIVAMVAGVPEKTEAQVLPNKVTPFVSVYGNLTDTVVGTATNTCIYVDLLRGIKLW